jgi:Ca2+-transporting ATPase
VPAWHTLEIQDALLAQGVDSASGLSAAEVESRVQKYGPNAFAVAKKESAFQVFVRQYKDPMQIVLLAAGVVSILIQQLGTGIVLLGLTLFNAMMGMSQEGKAEASVAALQKMLIVKTRVRRGGEVTQLPAEQLVPGDIVLVEAGDRVPADGRLLKAATLEVDESALTGESVPVPKQVESVAGADTPLGDRVDMVYMNTNVTRGTAELVVTATGMSTEVGHISGMLAATELEKTPLTQQLDALTKQIIIIAMAALAVSIAIGLARGQQAEVLLVTAIAFAIAAIPTGLPAVVTYLLATGTATLAAAHAIVKRLRSVETLGATSAINSDKTGTLTLNQMTAVEMSIIGQRLTVSGEGYSTNGRITHVGGLAEVDLEPFLLPMALASDAVARDGALIGDPTEGALVVLAAKGGIDPVETRKEFPRIAEVPFDAAYKLMATFHRMTDADGREVIRCFVKGAPDQLLARATNALTAEGKLEAVADMRDRFQTYNAQLGAQGLRVMALARRDFDPASFDSRAADFLPLIEDLTLLALVGIVDPARPEARVAIAQAHAAGIQVRMITGDHAVTAAAIASQLGIRGRAITGAEFSAMSDEEADQKINDIGVIARVTPEDKVRLVEVLKRAGHIVSMTGDGVNDAPALKKADIGVAMGITGTEVSKEAAVMILTDDNFATIVRAVELGRALYDSLVKYIRFQMARLFGFILLFLGAAIFNVLGGVPFLPLQTLYVNFTIDLFLAIGIGLGAASPGLMERPPRGSKAQILPRKSLMAVVGLGLVIAASTLGIQWAFAPQGDALARSMGFVTFGLAGIFLALEVNDERGSMFGRATLDNGKLVQMSFFAVVATILVTELGLFQKLFDTVSLSAAQWVTCLVAALAIVVVMEVEKLIRRRRSNSEVSEEASHVLEPSTNAV